MTNPCVKNLAYLERCIFLLICDREAESNLSFAKSVIVVGYHLRTSDENDLPQHFIIYLNFSFTSMNKRRRVIKTKEN